MAVVPDVSGYISDIPIKKNELIDSGATLGQIETARFENAIEAAAAELEAAGQSVVSSTASVTTATAALAQTQAKLEEVRVQSSRIFVLEEKGIYAAAKGDEARALVASAEAVVAASEAELTRAQEELGDTGENNPELRIAVTKLIDARMNLECATLKAPSNGVIGGLKIDEGAFASAGQPLMTLISIEDQWIEAFMTENNLGHVSIGDKVEITFDAFPGEVFAGKIKSAAWGVSTDKVTIFGDLPTAAKSKGWLRDPQRLSVIIETTDYQPHTDASRQGLRYNSQVNVIAYTGGRPFWNTLAKVWIMVVSQLSFLYKSTPEYGNGIITWLLPLHHMNLNTAEQFG